MNVNSQNVKAWEGKKLFSGGKKKGKNQENNEQTEVSRKTKKEGLKEKEKKRDRDPRLWKKGENKNKEKM